MATTQIKRLYLNSKEFVPITLAEAVVVNTDDMSLMDGLGITTLDNVLRIALNITGNSASSIDTLNLALNNINSALSNKLDKLTAGDGISIVNGVISVTNSTNLALYRIVNLLPYPATANNLNYIYLYPSSEGAAGNVYKEAICYEKNGEYYWEELGSIKSDVSLDGYVEKTVYQAKITEIETAITNINNTIITASEIKTTDGDTVLVNYSIPNDLYDSMVN